MESSGTLEKTALAASCFCRAGRDGGPSALKAAAATAAAARAPRAASDKRCITQELPHDGVGLLEGLGSMGGVEEQPVNDVDLLGVVLWSGDSVSKRLDFK